MNRVAAVIALAIFAVQAHATSSRLPKDCPREFVTVWERRSFLKSVPTPREPCVLHGETGIYVCDDHGCVRP